MYAIFDYHRFADRREREREREIDIAGVRILEPIPTNSFMVFDVNDVNARSLFQVHQQ